MNENIVKINYKDKEIYLVKTAHVSKNSVQDVIDTCNEVNPDSICIELDQERYESISNKEKWRDSDIVQVIKEKRVGFLMVNIILSSFQKRMATKMDNTSGQEMITGIELAKEGNKELVLADRSIKLTFTRIWNKLGLWEKLKLIYAIISSIFEDEELTEEDLQQLKQSDMLEAAINDVGKSFPVVKKVLIDERDQYLAYKIKNAKGPKIVAVVGAGHGNGIVRWINEDYSISELDDPAKKKGLSSYSGWIIPAIIIGIIAYTFIANRSLGISQMKTWFLWNGTLSALGVALALGHPLTILTAFLVAPFTSLNPLLAAGWFAGLVEATIRKPKVKDFEDLSIDTSSFKGFWKNRVTRILLIVIFANVFSTLGTVISGLDIFKSFIDVL